MTTKQVQIKTLGVSERTWKTLEELLMDHTPDEVVQMVHRYCDRVDHEKNFRLRKATELAMLKARVAAIDKEKEA